jgi:thiol-disulfide isomerase/thioredoxin
MVAAAAGLAGYYFNRASLSSPATVGAAQALMLAPLTDPSGNTQSLSQWRGKVLVVNFWATWCPPCREEIPVLKKVYQKYVANGVEFVGIALDNAAKVREYAAEMNIDYALRIGGPETLAISKGLGNPAGVLPFTIVLNRGGEVVYTHVGALTDATLDAVLLPLL